MRQTTEPASPAAGGSYCMTATDAHGNPRLLSGILVEVSTDGLSASDSIETALVSLFNG